MHDRKSLYSRNKRNSRAILCPDAFEQDHPLTPEQFSYEEEFRFWKCGQTRITTAGNSQIICFLLVHCTENCCSLF